ncbi:MAG: GWxTD domain-containing protein [Bacteroidia bacterium]
MKHFITLLVVIVISTATNAKNLRVYTMHTTFKGENNTTLIEHYLAFDAYTAQAKKIASGYQASIQVGILISDQNGNAVYANKYNVLSPIQPKERLQGEFIDIQRFALPSGKYTLALELKDNNDTIKPIENTQQLIVPSYTDSLLFSSIELIESFEASTEQKASVKNGFDIIPYVSNYYGNEAKQINFYVELYNAAKYLGTDQGYLIKYYLKNADTKETLNDFANFSRNKASERMGFIGALSLTNLPTGNYLLCTDAVDKTNTVRSHNEFFIQHYGINSSYYNTADSSNNFFAQITNVDTLNDLVRSMKPIATAGQKGYIDNIGKDVNTKLKQQFLYNFWLERSPNNTYEAYTKYMKEVAYVNKMYKTIMFKGYQADRGRVYLQYGKPSLANTYDREPNSYPYEIWQYNTTDKRNNRRFVFYNPSLSGNDFVLIHSDAYGELRNERWQVLISGRNGKTVGVDQTQTPSLYGEHPRESYQQYDNFVPINDADKVRVPPKR